MRKYILIALAFLFCTYSNAQAVFTLPIEGTYGKDWFIVNHVDEDTTANFIDAFCGTKSYNGHYGTDFVIRNFNHMDAGVNILAPAAGQVFVTQDGLFDRNKKSVIANGFGNYIGIKHTINGQNYFTYYAHLKKGSLKVDSGDMVTQGQVLAQVGSSGNSEDPHLHFEVYNDTIVLDPWDAPCQFTPNTTLWINPPTYDTAFAIIDSGGFQQDFIPFLDTIREPDSIAAFSHPLGLFVDKSKEYRTVWFLAKGIRKNDTITSKWYHEGSLLSTYNYIADKDYWYFYFWDYIHRDSIPTNSYLATGTIISLNGKDIFGVELKTTIISVLEIAKQFSIAQTPQGLELKANGNQKVSGVEAFTLLGQRTKVQLEQTATNTLLIRRSDATQPLFLRLETDRGTFSYKWMPVY